MAFRQVKNSLKQLNMKQVKTFVGLYFIFGRVPALRLGRCILHSAFAAVLRYAPHCLTACVMHLTQVHTAITLFSILFPFSLQVRAQEKYSWMYPQLNYIQFYDRKDIEPLYQAWQNVDKQKLVILHMGDSHLQSGYYPERLREELIKVLGDGGQGIMVNYSAVKTYPSCAVTTSCTGNWTAARCIVLKPKLTLGVSGMTVHTQEEGATLSFTLNRENIKNYTLLKLLVKKDTTCFDFEIETGDKKILVKTFSYPEKPEITISLDNFTSKTITLRTIKTSPIQDHFEFYGMSLESAENKGLLLHNAGVGASRFLSVLLQDLFMQQLPVFSPNLVILDYGTNDYLYKDKIDTSLETEIKKIIENIRAACPNAVIMLTTTQDMKKRNVSLKSAVKFVDLIHKIAQEEHCIIYDWYWISGGYGVAKEWNQAGLMSRDMVHLTPRGYQLKGEFLADAFKNTIRWLQNNPSQNSYILPIDSIKKESLDKIAKDKSKPSTQPIIIPHGQKEYIYTIQPGDTLGKIAVQFKVTVKELQAWNGLNDTRIYAGKTLKIYLK
ncbi:MAG: LysM peptidoglycan-binding domain-containing protein [Bacteroidia bacterium]|nr:LysM peptidoglycan-binding domain-containing protein [Bacteroidia bacterium]MDW8302434.1 LysM peptidoglycan-binding domain-containing protein [Bacteroidia bacterium]